LQAASEHAPEAPLEEALDLLLDVAQEAHAIGPRRVADALAGTRRPTLRQGRSDQATMTTAAGSTAPTAASAVADVATRSAPRPATQAAAAAARGAPARARVTSGTHIAAATRTAACTSASGR